MAYETFKLEGTEEVMKALDVYIGSVPELVYDELEVWAESILSESRKEVPWDTTHLLQTGTVEPYTEGDFVGFEIGYNAKSDSIIHEGYPYNYGIRQHEDLTLYHPKPGRKAKFLEDPFNRIKGNVLPGIVAKVDSYFQQGIPNMAGISGRLGASLGSRGGRFVSGNTSGQYVSKKAKARSALGNLGGRFI
jgi:hypothetical protein